MSGCDCMSNHQTVESSNPTPGTADSFLFFLTKVYRFDTKKESYAVYTTRCYNSVLAVKRQRQTYGLLCL